MSLSVADLEKMSNSELLKLAAVLESKHVGKFKGEISYYKQQALNATQKLPAPVKYRKGQEKLAVDQLEKLIANAEAEMLRLVKQRKDVTYPPPPALLLKGQGIRPQPEPVAALSKTAFEARMKAVLRDAYRRAFDLGTLATGIMRTEPGLVTHQGVDEKKWLENAFSAEMKHFAKLLRAIENDNSKTSVAARIHNYAEAIRSVYESSRVIQIPMLVLIHWVGESKNPCEECRLMMRLSPFTKETLPITPKSGGTRCLAHCQCSLRITKATRDEVERVARKNRSVEYLLRQLRQSRKRKHKH